MWKVDSVNVYHRGDGLYEFTATAFCPGNWVKAVFSFDLTSDTKEHALFDGVMKLANYDVVCEGYSVEYTN